MAVNRPPLRNHLPLKLVHNFPAAAVVMPWGHLVATCPGHRNSGIKNGRKFRKRREGLFQIDSGKPGTEQALEKQKRHDQTFHPPKGGIMRNLNIVIILTIVVALGFMYSGCGETKSMMSEMTGTWKSDKNNEPIRIDFSGKQKAIEIGSSTVPVKINNVDEGSYMVKIDATLANGNAAVWSLRQVWDDNGSSFTIKFNHDGVEETLTRG